MFRYLLHTVFIVAHSRQKINSFSKYLWVFPTLSALRLHVFLGREAEGQNICQGGGFKALFIYQI